MSDQLVVPSLVEDEGYLFNLLAKLMSEDYFLKEDELITLGELDIPLEEYFDSEIKNRFKDFESIVPLFKVVEREGKKITEFSHDGLDLDDPDTLTSTIAAVNDFIEIMERLKIEYKETEESQKAILKRKLMAGLLNLLQVKVRLNENSDEKIPLSKLGYGINEFAEDILKREVYLRYKPLVDLFIQNEESLNEIDTEELRLLSLSDIKEALSLIEPFKSSLVEYKGAPLKSGTVETGNEKSIDLFDPLMMYCFSRKSVSPFMLKAFGFELTPEKIMFLYYCGKLNIFGAYLLLQSEKENSNLRSSLSTVSKVSPFNDFFSTYRTDMKMSGANYRMMASFLGNSPFMFLRNFN